MVATILAVLAPALAQLTPTPRVVGGTEVTAYRYPFLVSLRSYSSHICGGSLILSSWVLTAAHCVDTSRPAISYSVLLHGHDKASVSGHRCTEVITAARTICHPSYNSNSMQADVCLLQLQRPAACGAELAARGALAHLDADGSGFTAAGTMVTVAGWGATSMSDGHSAVAGVPRWPQRPREVTLPLISSPSCKAQYGTITLGK